MYEYPNYNQEITRFFGNLENDNKGHFYRPIQHISPERQQLLINSINHDIFYKGYAEINLSSTKEITSQVLEYVSDLSKLRVRIEGGFNSIYGQIKNKYEKDYFDNRITYTGYEALAIIKKIESLEARIDMILPPTERARQISNIVANEYNYSQKFKDDRFGGTYIERHKIVASLRGITSYNIFGEEGLVCAGYAQLYKELCNRANITCDYIRGTSIDRYSGSRGVHVWNVVIGTNGEQIPVDVTWQSSDDDPDMWFGQSDEFNITHIADEDESFKDYKPIIYDKPKNDYIAYIIQAMDNKYERGRGNCSLMKYLVTKDETEITNSWNARSFLQSINDDDIKEYFNHIPRSERTRTVLLVIQNMLIENFGRKIAEDYFNFFVETGETDFFPHELKIVAERWLNKTDIDNFCMEQNERNNNLIN